MNQIAGGLEGIAQGALLISLMAVSQHNSEISFLASAVLMIFFQSSFSKPGCQRGIWGLYPCSQ